MLLKETAPVIIKGNTVRLQGVVDSHAWTFVLFLEFNGAFKESQTHQRGFTALPGKGHFWNALGFNVLARECIQQVIRHTETAVRVESFFRQVVAVFTVEVADRPPWLDHHVKGWRQHKSRTCRRHCTVLAHSW
ncbi:hypothetical protein ES707_19783 [subsurface metagenome]